MTLEVTAFKNGPCVMKGTATYTDAEGKEQQTPGTSVALCRCGQSANKPFCDGTHKKIGFEADEIVLLLDEK